MKILVATVQVPFIRGGAEIHAEGLVKAIRAAGHQAEIVAIPFKWYPPERILDNMLACRLLDLSEFCGESIDRVIALKFPAYLIPHHNKVIWLLHQYRQAYELWGSDYSDLMHSPNGIQVKEAILNADNRVFRECIATYTNSKNVSKRLKQFNRVDSIPLYHPPQNADSFYCDEHLGYFFFPSRLTTIKRQELVIKSLAHTHKDIKIIFAGTADAESYHTHLLQVAQKLGVKERVLFLGGISEQEKFKYYAQALGVIYPPFDEDYGYVTLEAMLSSKPVITCTDSGGPTEFIRDRETGFITQANPESLASAMNELWENVSWAKILGLRARELYDSLNINWSYAIANLLQ
jgi:glycosyltransferase involved in cell wall biosynthesis